MSASPAINSGNTFLKGWLRRDSLLLQVLAAIVFGMILSFLWNGFSSWPQAWILPIKEWLTQLFRWLDKEASLGLFTVKDITRTI